MKMRQSILRASLVLLAVLLPLGLIKEIALATQHTNEPAYFRFDCPPDPQTFIFQLSDPELIDEARAMLAGLQPPRHVMGQIVKQPELYNSPWSFHLEPGSILFFNNATEVCDATIIAVEENLDQACGAFLPGCIWCPWRSRLIEEVPPPAEEWPRAYLPFISR